MCKPFKVKMVQKQSNFAKWLRLVLIISYVHSSQTEADATSYSLFDFEQTKIDLFSNSNFMNPSKVSVFNSQNSRQDDSECSKQLTEIKNALTNSEKWAMKRKYKKFFFESQLFI